MAKNARLRQSPTACCANGWIRTARTAISIRIKKDDDVDQMLKNFEVTLSLLPAGFDELQGDKCAFCKGEIIRTRAPDMPSSTLRTASPKTRRACSSGLGKKVRTAQSRFLMPISASR